MHFGYSWVFVEKEVILSKKKSLVYLTLSLIFFLVLSGCSMKSKTQQPENLQKGWIKMYSGVAFVNSITQTEDGGYIIAGDTSIHATGDGGVGETEPTAGFGGLLAADIFVMKINSDGREEWIKVLGGNLFDGSSIAIQTNDGGCIVAGESFSFSNGYYGVIVAKLDKNGNKQWVKLLCDYKDRYPQNMGYFSFRQTSDGGFIVLDRSLIIKLDSKANLEWATHMVNSTSVCESREGGYVCVGMSSLSFGMNVGGILILKLDKDGNKQWAKMIWGIEGSYDYIARSVENTDDGGYIIVGRRSVAHSPDQDNAIIIKINKDGQKEWARVLSKSTKDYSGAYSILQTNSGYLIGGTESNDFGNKHDAFILKIDRAGNEQWAKRFYGEEWDDEYNTSLICETKDNCLLATISPSYRSKYKSICYSGIIKINSNGDLGLSCDYFREYEISMKNIETTVRDVTESIGVKERWSVKIENINPTFTSKDVQATTICDGK